LSFIFVLGAVISGVYGATVKRPALAALGREEECAGVKCASVSSGASAARRLRRQSA
jgi:hypothetical protein